MDQPNISSDTTRIVDHFFRHESGRIIAHLTNKFGTENISLAEDSVQEAMIKAMQLWPFKGIPDNPSAWILTVSRNRMIDVLRRRSRTDLVIEFSEDSRPTEINQDLDNAFNDDQLKMIFVCCHPLLSHENQIILTLKILCGFGIKEIARALLKNESAVAKAYSRARSKLQESKESYDLLTPGDIQNRLSVVLKIIYLMFNEGYGSISEDSLIRKDLCLESMRLGRILQRHDSIKDTRVEALMALMCYQAARFDSRIDDEGSMITIENQDRNQWETELIKKGNYFLEMAHDDTISEYHIEASIAGCHVNVSDYRSTDWQSILNLYDLYLRFSPSNIVALNRIVAYEKVHGSRKSLLEISKIKEPLKEYYLFYAIHADLLVKEGKYKEAIRALEQSIDLTRNKAEKKHLKKKLDNIKND